MHHTTFMDCCRRVSPMGGGEKHAPRTPLTVASSQQFVSRRQRYLVAQEKFTERPLTAIVPKAGREQLFLFYHASLYGGHLGRTQTLARLSDRFYLMQIYSSWYMEENSA